jgi:hypothetical protein
MKNWVVPFVLFALLFSACAAPKPYYETRVGKKKQKYYNAIQFGAKDRPKMKF